MTHSIRKGKNNSGWEVFFIYYTGHFIEINVVMIFDNMDSAIKLCNQLNGGSCK